MFWSRAGAITTNTLIPISLVIVLGSIIYFIGGLATRVDAIAENDSPSRNEFNRLCSDLNEIKTGINGINSYLINKNNLVIKNQ